MAKTAKVGKSRQTFTDEQKADALALVVEYRNDFARAAKVAHVPEKLLRLWAVGRGVSRAVFLQFMQQRITFLEELRMTLPPPFGSARASEEPRKTCDFDNEMRA